MGVQVIVPHRAPDLDALGAAIAARVLYPQARIVLQGNLSPGAAEFASLHRYQIEAVRPKDINLAALTLAVVVDTQDPDRTGALAGVLGAEGVPRHVYDHHPREAGDLEGELEVTAVVGATCTLMAEILQEASAAIEPYVATALLLGIYADTGNLTLPGTTPRDAHAAAWLLERGANLRAVVSFLTSDLTPSQQELLAQLQGHWHEVPVQRNRIGVATGRTGTYVDGLSVIIEHLQEIRPAAATFVAVEMLGRVYLVGRSEVPWIDVTSAMGHFGGGGHPGAASAVVRGRGPEDVIRELCALLEGNIGSPLSASDLMKSPVRAVTEYLPAGEAHRLMLRYGHSGMPVVDQSGRIIGVISRRDTEKALKAGLGRAPVKGFMSRPAITVAPDTDLDEIQRLMLENDIGRVPVINDGRLVGIVSRTDVLGQLYGGLPPRWHRRLIPSGVAPASGQQRLADAAGHLPAAVRDILRSAGTVARELAMPAYAVGGFLRDLLLRQPNLDLDIVVEGDGLPYARALGARLPAKVEEVPRFGTAHLYLAGGLRVDVATARREFYEFAAALPRVEQADLRADLERRDFTINAMACRLSPEGSGQLLDFFGGFDDLRAGLIRVLHSLSFVEDPTRMLRAARLACRYGFDLEGETAALLGEAVAAGVLERVSTERIATELQAILREDTASAALSLLGRTGVLARILPDVAWTEPVAALLNACTRLAARAGGPAGLAASVERWLLRSLALCLAARPGRWPALLERLRLSRGQRLAAERVLGAWPEALARLAGERCPPSQLVSLLRDWPAEGVALLWAVARQQGNRRVLRRLHGYWTRHRHVRLQVTGSDLRRLGFLPGPAYSRVLEQALAIKLDRGLPDRRAELELVQRLARGAGAAKANDRQ